MGSEVVNHENHLLSVLLTLLDEIERDVAVEVEDQVFKLHRVILTKHSPVFAKMLSPSFRESSLVSESEPIRLPGKRADIFQLLVDYLYSGRIELGALDLSNLGELIMMAHEYDIEKLVTAIAQHIQQITTVENALEIFDGIGLLLGIDAVIDSCLKCVDANARTILESEEFCGLSVDAVCRIVSRDEFLALESDIIFALSRWLKANKLSNNINMRKQVVSQIRFGLVSLDGLSMKQISELFRITASWQVDMGDQTNTDNPRVLRPMENMATLLAGATVSTAPACDYSLDLFAAHPISDEAGPNVGIVVKLAKACLVESIKIAMPSYYAGGWKATGSECGRCPSCIFDECRCAPNYRFSLLTSLDNKEWTTVVNCHEDYLGGTLLILFESRPVIFVKIVGISERRGKPEFRVEAFECPATNPRLHLGSGEQTSVIQLKGASKI